VWHTLSKISKATDFKFCTQLRLAPSHKIVCNISEWGRGLGHVTPILVDISSTISPKPVKATVFKFGTQLRLGPSQKSGVYFCRGSGPGNVNLAISETSKGRQLKFGSQLRLGRSHKMFAYCI